MTVESATLPSSLYDPIVTVPLQHVCFLNTLNSTFNMTWQTKQIKGMISRTRHPDQTRPESRSDDLQIEGSRLEALFPPSSFNFTLPIWIRASDAEVFSIPKWCLTLLFTLQQISMYRFDLQLPTLAHTPLLGHVD